MDQLTLTLIRLGFLAVLWMFVLAAITVIRTDIFGTKQTAPKAKPAKKTAASRPPKAPKKSKASRGQPRVLVVVSGPNAGQSVPLTGAPVLIGRSTDAAVRLEDDYVSSRHARFATNGEQWFVEDLGSTNGTYVGSHRVTAPMPIGVGTEVRIGKTIVELRK